MTSAAISKAVVTGGSGFIGQALVRRLATDGVNVVTVDVNPPAVADVACFALQADVAEPGVLDRHITDETVIFHLAAHADVAGSVSNPRRDFENTLQPLFEVLESARRIGSRVIFPSTASVFDLDAAMPLSETAPKRPSSPYGAAKLAGESYCIAYKRSFGVDARIVRMFSVYGVGMRRFFIHDVVRKLQHDRTRLEIVGDGQQVRDYLYIDDAVEGLLCVAGAGQAGDDYNVASGEPVVIGELAQRIAAMLGCPQVRIEPTGRSFPGDTPRWYADITKARGLGFSPRVSLDDGLKRTIESLSS